MAGTRALFASIGAGAALIAAAALALLAVSAMFAFGGWNDTLAKSAKSPVLVFAESPLPQSDAPAAAGSDGTLRIVAPAPGPSAFRRAADRSNALLPNAVDVAEPPRTSVVTDVKVAPDLNAPAVTAPPEPARPAAAAPRKNGDRVRKLGDTLSSTVRDTGTALANATAPLAPPVSAAVQQVLNLVADVVRRASGGLGNTLDALSPQQ